MSDFENTVISENEAIAHIVSCYEKENITCARRHFSSCIPNKSWITIEVCFADEGTRSQSLKKPILVADCQKRKSLRGFSNDGYPELTITPIPIFVYCATCQALNSHETTDCIATDNTGNNAECEETETNDDGKEPDEEPLEETENSEIEDGESKDEEDVKKRQGRMTRKAIALLPLRVIKTFR
ncbi:hypothetical protein BJV82DRAFT_664596 [Fennellomyces sp. T-0311]|nr:hypothetical protein BJV82DRAFT_664596 [Fennellomyces sp. T-0311]